MGALRSHDITVTTDEVVAEMRSLDGKLVELAIARVLHRKTAAALDAVADQVDGDTPNTPVG